METRFVLFKIDSSQKTNVADGKAIRTKNKFRYNTITTFEKRLLALEKYVNEPDVNTGTDKSSLAIHEGPDTFDIFVKSEVDDGDCTVYDIGDSIKEEGTQHGENEKPVGNDQRQTFSVADETNEHQMKHFNESTEQSPNSSTQASRFGFWRRIGEEQESALFDYLEKHRELCLEVNAADRDMVALRNMWADLTNLLNSLPGPEYSTNEWQQCLASYKSVAHRKRRMAGAQMTAARSSSTDFISYPLTSFEERLLALCGYFSEPGGSDESSPAKVIRDSSAEVGKSEVGVASSSVAWDQVGTRDPVEEQYVETTKTSGSSTEQKNSGTIEKFAQKKHPVAINTSQLIMADDSNEFLTLDQAEAMIEFMKANPSCDLYKWDEDRTNPKLVPFWVYLCNKLNKLGPRKDPDGWKKCWCLLKDSTNKKSLLGKELSSFEVQILKFAKSKPVFMVKEDRKDVFMMKEIVRKTLPGDVEVSVVERELGSDDKEDISLENQQESLLLKRGKYIRKRMTNQQKSTIVEFMLRNPLAQNYKGGSTPGKKKYRALWEELTEQLNSLGTQKSSLEWRRAWTDLKSNVMKKIEKGTEELTKLETEIRRMKCSEEDVAASIVSGRITTPNSKDNSMITVNMKDLQNALNHSINEAGGSGIIFTFDSNEQSEVKTEEMSESNNFRLH
uniref:Regulatory protein zeste n=1 Tax=Lygus hesperus TaxID=30085 RepID=A0A0A9WE07_LYGHE